MGTVVAAALAVIVGAVLSVSTVLTLASVRTGPTPAEVAQQRLAEQGESGMSADEVSDALLNELAYGS